MSDSQRLRRETRCGHVNNCAASNNAHEIHAPSPNGCADQMAVVPKKSSWVPLVSPDRCESDNLRCRGWEDLQYRRALSRGSELTSRWLEAQGRPSPLRRFGAPSCKKVHFRLTSFKFKQLIKSKASSPPATNLRWQKAPKKWTSLFQNGYRLSRQ